MLQQAQPMKQSEQQPPFLQPPVQPQQAQQVQQPQEQPAQQPAQQQLPNNIKQVTVILDEESLTILKDAYPQFADSIINCGIKMFADTEMYKKYMLDLKNVQKGQSALETTVQSATQSTSNNVNAQPPDTQAAPAAPAGGFSSW